MHPVQQPRPAALMSWHIYALKPERMPFKAWRCAGGIVSADRGRPNLSNVFVCGVYGVFLSSYYTVWERPRFRLYRCFVVLCWHVFSGCQSDNVSVLLLATGDWVWVLFSWSNIPGYFQHNVFEQHLWIIFILQFCKNEQGLTEMQVRGFKKWFLYL